jgi:hypothetical protein
MRKWHGYLQRIVTHPGKMKVQDLRECGIDSANGLNSSDGSTKYSFAKCKECETSALISTSEAHSLELAGRSGNAS